MSLCSVVAMVAHEGTIFWRSARKTNLNKSKSRENASNFYMTVMIPFQFSNQSMSISHANGYFAVSMCTPVWPQHGARVICSPLLRWAEPYRNNWWRFSPWKTCTNFSCFFFFFFLLVAAQTFYARSPIGHSHSTEERHE